MTPEIANPPPDLGEETVYLSAEEALHEVFPETASVDTVAASLRPAEMEELRRILGNPVPSDEIVVYRPRDAGGAPLGYALVTEEVGKYRPFTFLVGVAPDLTVRNVEVLVYRESRGGEVRRTRFLRQYRGKSAGDPIRLNRDILNIAGATLSVNALNHGVKRVLLTVKALAARGAL